MILKKNIHCAKSRTITLKNKKNDVVVFKIFNNMEIVNSNKIPVFKLEMITRVIELNIYERFVQTKKHFY